MIWLRIFVYLVVALMLLPVLITFPVALTAVARISFPPIGLSGRWFFAILNDSVLLASIVRSFWLGIQRICRWTSLSIPC